MDKVVRDSVTCRSQKSKSKVSGMEEHVSCLFSVESCGGGGEYWQISSQLEAEDNLVRLREESEMDIVEEEGILKKDCSSGGARRRPNSRSSLSSRSRGRCWSLRDIIIVTGAMLLLMLCWCCSEVSAKGPEMMPEDDFDSSNKKVKFEDFDTVIKVSSLF